MALACFLAAQLAFRRSADRPKRRWPVAVYGVGAALALAHYLAAFGWHYDWSHAQAVLATAEHTERVFGLDWGGGVWVNYAFLGTWVVELSWRARRGEIRQPAVRWGLRAFYLIVIANGAVVFVAWPLQLVGGMLVAGLLWSWCPKRQLTR